MAGSMCMLASTASSAPVRSELDWVRHQLDLLAECRSLSGFTAPDAERWRTLVERERELLDCRRCT